MVQTTCMVTWWVPIKSPTKILTKTALQYFWNIVLLQEHAMSYKALLVYLTEDISAEISSNHCWNQGNLK